VVADGGGVERDGAVAMPGRGVGRGGGGGPAGRLVELLGAERFGPPWLREVMREAGVSAEVVRALAQQGEIVRLSDDIAFTRDAFGRAVALVRDLIAAEGSVTVASLRDRMGASRRPVLALLEHLDAQRVTRRVGDARVLR